MPLRLLAAIAFLGTIGVMVTWYMNKPEPTRTPLSTGTVKVANATVTVELADSPDARQQGLSGRASLAENAGMLFIFEAPGKYSFWMKDMNFPLDFIWISNRQVIDLDRHVPAPTPVPPTVEPDQPVSHVLEVPAGFIDRHQIKIGDPVDIDVQSGS